MAALLERNERRAVNAAKQLLGEFWWTYLIQIALENRRRSFDLQHILPQVLIAQRLERMD